MDQIDLVNELENIKSLDKKNKESKINSKEPVLWSYETDEPHYQLVHTFLFNYITNQEFLAKDPINREDFIMFIQLLRSYNLFKPKADVLMENVIQEFDELEKKEKNRKADRGQDGN